MAGIWGITNVQRVLLLLLLGHLQPESAPCSVDRLSSKLRQQDPDLRQLGRRIELAAGQQASDFHIDARLSRDSTRQALAPQDLQEERPKPRRSAPSVPLLVAWSAAGPLTPAT